jgi:7,8-dihydropterin-6-yl-methyl-4-(beta-D-ribofuranosyl)aminobenzene 5'-phosphate synthase
MMKEINRREFLMASAAASATLMAGTILKGGPSMAYASVKIPEVEKLTVTVITDNYYDCLRWNYKIAKRQLKVPGASSIWDSFSFHAEHGLAYYIETVVNGKSNAFMFDYGMDFEGVSKNMEILGIDLNKLEALALSHGHLDHWGNLIPMLKSNGKKIRKGIHLYVGGDAFDNKFANLPPVYKPLDGLADLGQLNRGELESLDRVKIVEVKEPAPIVPGAYMTGDIERVTEYEKGSPILMVKKGDKMERDYFSGEQSLMFNVKGKGLVVLSSCAHSGIVNTVKHAQKVTGIDKVHTVIGGFHLTGAKPEVIQRTIADIKAVAPVYIVPMHCSGFEAISGFSRAMPEQFIINVAGTRYEITA